MSAVPPIGQILNEFAQREAWDWTELELQLLAREDTIAAMIRSAGAQFGLYPQIVAEVLATIGIGTPISEEERALVRANFILLMQELQGGNN